LNRRLAAPVYLGVLPITRGPGGRLRLGGGGAAVEHVVRMRRLPKERVLKSLVATDAAEPALLRSLARLIAEFHLQAPNDGEVAAHGAPDALVARWDDNLRGSAAFAGSLFAPEDHAILTDFGPSFVRVHETLLRARQSGGRIREGHGDLHAEHVYFLDRTLAALADAPAVPSGAIVVDCIEFSRAFRCADVAAEIAFLAMDLERLGRADLAAAFVDAYADAAGDPRVRDLQPFYVCHRACIRAKVEALKSAEPEVAAAERTAAAARAREYFGLALRHAWRAGNPVLIAVVGLSGSGKTALARALAQASGFACLSSDVVRKAMPDDAGGTTGYGAGRYAPAARAAVYDLLLDEADRVLARGESVIVDATFIERARRDAAARVAHARGRRHVFIECRVSADVIRRRLEARTSADVSDARWETYVRQRETAAPLHADEPAITIDTGGDLAAARAAALRALWRWRHGRSAAP
jgi:aminoglycoside phosphotransferase family enzyme/predicted kinase